MLNLTRMHDALAALTGFKRNLSAFLLGVCATLAMPPVHLFPLLVVSCTGLLWLIASAPNQKRAAWDGWFWGWGFYMTGLYWFCIALLTDADKFAWLIPFALFGLTGVIAMYSALVGWLTWHASRRVQGIALVSAFTFIWAAVEYARGHLLTGFPWNLAGYAWAFSDWASQGVSVVGIYGLTLLTVLAASIPAALNRKAVLVVWGAFALMVAGGGARLYMADQLPADQRDVPGVSLRIVQGNIKQHHKWDPALQMKGLEHYITLTVSPGIGKVTHVIWPETAVPYVLERKSQMGAILSEMLPPQATLLTGALRTEGKDKDFRIWNSLVGLDAKGEWVTTYSKHKLVPFGEFVPLRGILPVEKITQGNVDFSAGPGPVTLRAGNAPPFLPLICYEAIFPSAAANENERPDWLLNITNDAWFGTSSGPYQHFAFSRYRAIEQGVPLVRAANTGISAVTDAYGRVRGMLPLNTEGYLDISLPNKSGISTYGRYGDKSFLVLMLLIGAFILIYQRNRNFKK